jgi:acyl-CoA thioesterase I
VDGEHRFGRHAVIAFGCALLLSGCSTSATPASSSSPTFASSSTPREAWSVVALGDSVPRGTNCGCTPYPQLTASYLTASDRREVKATNDAVGGFTSADVVKQLSSDSAVVSDVANADVVEIEIGANDVAYSGSCGTTVACYQPMISSTERNLEQIVARIHQLTEGRPIQLILLDYWSVWLGGRYADAEGPVYVDAVASVTDQVNTVIKRTAADTDSGYVDLRAIFKGPDYDSDETPYLASDGDHPNAAGHQKIAAAVIDVVSQSLH